MDIKDSYLHGTVGVVKSISVDADKLTYKLADKDNTSVDVTMPTATQSANGLLSSTDKKKLDSITGPTQSIPYIVGPDTDTTAGTWTGSYSGITAYTDGLTIIYVPKVAGASTTTLNINGLGAKTCYYNNANKLTTHYAAGTPILFTYIGGGWKRADYYSDSNTYTSAYCTTVSATADKVASCSNYALKANSYVHVLIRYGNTSQTALTLNINSTGAKPIYINGTASSASNYTLPAGTYIVYYDGTNFYFRTDGMLPGKIEKARLSDLVTCTAGFGDVYRPIVVCTGDTGEVYHNAKITANYASGDLKATSFTGALKGTADKVANNLILKINSGTTEGTSLYTYNGSAAKTLDIKAGSNITLTAASNSLTIAASDTKVTQTNTTANAAYRVLLSENANDTTETTTARKSANLKFNPNTGNLSTETLLITRTTNAKHILFSRGSDTDYPYNYIAAPTGGKICILPNGVSNESSQGMHFDDTGLHPATTRAYSLGTSSYKWSSVYAGTFIGNLDGTYVNKLTGYTKATSASDLEATDSLNTALGKLEYKAGTAYDWYKSITEDDTDTIINKWGEIVDFIDSVAEGTDITDEFVTRKTNQTITGSKTFQLGNNTSFKLLKDTGSLQLDVSGNKESWARNIIFSGENTSTSNKVSARFGVLGDFTNDTITYLYLAHQDQNYSTAVFKVYSDKATINGNEIYHAGNDGSGSGLDADLLDGVHANGLLTALSSGTTNKVSLTVGGTTKNITTLYASYLCSVGTVNPQTGRTQAYGNVYSYRTNSNYHKGAPTTYTATIGFGQGAAGTVEICGEWTSGRGLWARALRDYEDDWYAWDRILTEATYATVLDSRYCKIGEYLPLAGGTMSGNIVVYTGASSRGLKFGTSYLNSLNNQLIWQSSEAIRFGSSDWDWNSWAGLKYNHDTKTIYLGLAEGTIFNTNSAQSGGTLKFPGVHQIVADSNSSTVGVPLVLKNSNWYSNMSTAIDFYNGSSYTVPNARIETKMVGSGNAGGTLIFYTQTKHESTNPNPNGLTERLRIDDNGLTKITGFLTVTGDLTAAKFITSGGTSSQFVKGDGSLDSNKYLINTHATNTSAYYRTINVNGTNYAFWSHTSKSAFTIYAPSTAGTKDQVLVSNGSGTPVWSDYNSLLPVKLINDPGKTVLIKSYGLNADFGTEDYGAPYEEYLQAFSKYLLDKAAGYTCIGCIRTGSRSSYICDVYDSGINDTTGLPQHITGHCFKFRGAHYHFGTSYGTWYWYTALHSANYANYTVTKTGGGASGTWGINITGNAETSDETLRFKNIMVANSADRDLNTGLFGGGLMRNYSGYASSYFTNHPTGMTYGCVLELSAYGKSTATNDLAGQLAWDINHHSTDSTRYLWWRANDDTNFSAAKWHRIAYIEDIPTITDYYWADVKISDSSSTTTAPTFGSVTTSTIKTDNATLYLRYNNDDAKSICLNNTAFIPTNAATDKINLGTSSNRWKSLYTSKLIIDNTGKLMPIDGNSRSAGVYGVYDSTKVGHVWSMGSSYKISDDGLSTGNMYGLVYFHTNWSNNSAYNTATREDNPITEVDNYAYGHQIAMVSNGRIEASLGTYVWSRNGFRKFNSSDAYVLLGGGGHKTISSLSVASAVTADYLKPTKIVSGVKFNLSNASWTDTGYTFASLTTGTYAVQVTSGSNLVASGIMSVYTNLSDTAGDEIPLHVYGTAGWRPYLRTYANKLQISSNDISVTSRTVTIKIAQIL